MLSYRQSLAKLALSLPQPIVMAEIGVHQGMTSAYLLSTMPDLTLFCVDNWKAYKEATPDDQSVYKARAKARIWEYGSRGRIIVADSLKAVDLVPDCDIVFVDADNSEEACHADLQAWWTKAKRCLAAHDYGKEDIPGVTMAVDRFAQEVAIAPVLIDGHIAVFWKPL